MTIVLSQDPTGPDLFTHEVFQVGALFCPDDLSSVWQEFSCYITPRYPEKSDLSYLARQDIRSVEELKNRSEYWGGPETVWPHFASLADKAGPGLGESRLFCFDAGTDAPFLRKAVQKTSAVDASMTRNVGGLLQATLDVSARGSMFGDKSAVRETVRAAGPYDRNAVCEAVFGAHGVSCSRLSDAKKRAEAVRQSYRSVLISLQNHSSQSSSKPNRSSYGPRNGPTIRRR
jgi:hypothetical protein